jgi:glycerol uptake facilitator-like aquaporin
MDTPAVVEFLGTSLLLGAVAFTSNPIFVVAALAIAIGLGGKTSGGHFNPAVTAMQLAAGKIGQNRALMYMLAQFGAAVFVWLVSSVVKV